MDSGWDGLPPELRTLLRLGDLVTPMALRVAATLRLTDHMREGRTDLESLAEVTKSDADALDRVIRHLVAAGVFAEAGPKNYTPTAVGDLLAHDHPFHQVGWLDTTHMVGRADLALIHLADAVRDGGPVHHLRYGRSFWDDTSEDPFLGATFDAMMAQNQDGVFEEAVARADWTGAGSVLDVGGGTGALLTTLLAVRPDIDATLVELPGVAANARKLLAEAGTAERIRVLDGDFFEPLPVSADIVTLAFILHDWPDDDALRILRRAACALHPDGRILLVERAGDSDGAPAADFTSADLKMLVYFGGCERTVDEWRALAARAGLRMTAMSEPFDHGTRVLTLAPA